MTTLFLLGFALGFVFGAAMTLALCVLWGIAVLISGMTQLKSNTTY